MMADSGPIPATYHDLPRGIDGRTKAARVFRERVEELVEHLGGPDMVTAPELAVIRRAAGLEALAFDLEGRIVAGEVLDDQELARYCGIINAQRRLFADLGYTRRARPVEAAIEELLPGRRHG